MDWLLIWPKMLTIFVRGAACTAKMTQWTPYIHSNPFHFPRRRQVLQHSSRLCSTIAWLNVWSALVHFSGYIGRWIQWLTSKSRSVTLMMYWVWAYKSSVWIKLGTNYCGGSSKNHSKCLLKRVSEFPMFLLVGFITSFMALDAEGQDSPRATKSPCDLASLI